MPAKQQFNIYLPAELVRRVKHASVDANQSLSTFVETALDAYLRQFDARQNRTRVRREPAPDHDLHA